MPDQPYIPVDPAEAARLANSLRPAGGDSFAQVLNILRQEPRRLESRQLGFSVDGGKLSAAQFGQPTPGGPQPWFWVPGN